jgi:diaminohydroxyphosphoribosylaminopyrimidine deaminase/5-amino-6-(5-phosphoribosylamino)uracil reductase
MAGRCQHATRTPQNRDGSVTDMSPAMDARYMAQALRLAAGGRYTTHPNPRVGCVIVKGGEIVGRGYHRKAGEDHAEVIALRAAGDRAHGATAYITMEPCSFQGKTPPCSLALIDAGIRRVVAGMTDPDSRVAGSGFRMLEEAGIEVRVPLLRSSAFELNPGFIKRNTVGLPFVRLKLAMTLDGKTALANGQSRWITGVAARRDVQRLRAASSAVVTGIRTVIDDDPALTVRAEELGTESAALAAAIPRPVVVLDPELRIPDSAGLLRNANAVVACLADAAQDREIPVEKLVLPAAPGRRIDLRAFLGELARRECNEVLFECGATLAGSVMAAGLVDELVLYIAPKLMGAGARSLLNLPEIDSMQNLIDVQITGVRQLGSDLRVTARVERKDA